MGFRDAASDAPADEAAPRPLDRRTPPLDELHQKALDARARGEDRIDVEVLGYGRAWVPFIVMHGCRGVVVARMRERVTDPTKTVDSGPVAKLLVRFAVIDIFVAQKREYLRRTQPRKSVPANHPRRRLRHVTIR